MQTRGVRWEPNVNDIFHPVQYRRCFPLFFKALYKIHHLWETLFEAGLNTQRIVAWSYKTTVYPVLDMMMMFIAALLGLEAWRRSWEREVLGESQPGQKQMQNITARSFWLGLLIQSQSRLRLMKPIPCATQCVLKYTYSSVISRTE